MAYDEELAERIRALMADEDGVLALPPDDAERLAVAAKERVARDKVMQEAISRGSTLFEQLSGFEQLQKVDAEIRDGHWRQR